MVDVLVAVGSNVEPMLYLPRALHALQDAYGPLQVSPAYRNKAVGFAGADFVNIVVGFATDDSLIRVRQRLQDIEAACDRPREAPKWAPRTMDLDILLYDAVVSSEPGLILPRPDLVRRAYMLKPAAQIAADVRHPTLGKTLRELWQEFDAAGHEMHEVTIPGFDRRPPPGSGR